MDHARVLLRAGRLLSLAFGLSFALVPGGWALHAMAGATAVGDLGRALDSWPFHLLDAAPDGLFATELLEATFLLLAGLLGFGAVLAWPLAMALAALGFSRALGRERPWARVALCLLLALLAIGSVWGIVQPYGSVWTRSANALVALVAGASAGVLAPRTEAPPHGRDG